jgi:hypothetical protein
MAITYFEEGMKKGYLRRYADPNAIIDVLYAPIYYRLQMAPLRCLTPTSTRFSTMR